MITTLTGENGFELKAELHKRVAAFVVEQGDMALERLDGSEVEFDRLREALQSLPFLAPRKMVVIRQGSANKQFAERAPELLTELPETTDVILVEPKLDKRSGYYKFLKKSTEFREFPALDAGALSRWLTAEAKARGGKLSSSDAWFLVERVGQNQQLLASELDKLLLHNPAISRQTIELLTEQTPQSTVFALLEAAFAGKTKVALELYREQRAQKVDPLQIIAMLAWQLHILALIKTARGRSPGEIAAAAKLNPYVVQKSQAIAARLSLPQLKKLVADLLVIDRRAKSESLDTDEALQNYLLGLAS